MRMTEYDAVLVGSGINSLVAGAMLARDGWNVCVLERNNYLGGGIKTAEITEPGFHHDVFSSGRPERMIPTIRRWAAALSLDHTIS